MFRGLACSGKGPSLPSASAEIKTRLAALEHVQAPRPGEKPPTFVFSRPADKRRKAEGATIVGFARISVTTLRVETTSRARADTLRARIEAACGDRLRHRMREHMDPMSARNAVPRQEGAPPPPEVQQAMAEIERAHYAAWVDEPVPALGGMTPREAVKTAPGREAVDLLLKDFENRQRRTRGSAGIDFSQIRRELRLE